MSVAKAGILRNGLKDKLMSGEVAISMAVRLTRTIEIVQIANNAGFDSLYIDNEHGSMTSDATGQICVASLLAGITPLVRVPNQSADTIARALDAGALGVIVPHIRSAREARDAVQAAKFPPDGARSISTALPQLDYQPTSIAELVQTINNATMVVAMIETQEAILNIREIAEVDGVDMLLVGTNDLTIEMGVAGQYDSPIVRDAYLRALEACHRSNKCLGIGGLSSRPDIMRDLIGRGARFVSVGHDLAFLAETAAKKSRDFRQIIESSVGNGEADKTLLSTPL